MMAHESDDGYERSDRLSQKHRRFEHAVDPCRLPGDRRAALRGDEAEQRIAGHDQVGENPQHRRGEDDREQSPRWRPSTIR